MSMQSKKIRDLPKDPDVVCVVCGHPDCCWAHLPHHDAGMGQKCDDFFGAPLCQQCHDYADGRAKTDRMGHSHQDGGQKDFEWRWIAMRRGLFLLWKRNIMHIEGAKA